MSTWEVWALRTGCSAVDQSMLTYLNGMGHEVTIPHTALLLRGDATVLIDTGFADPDVINSAYPQRIWRTPEQHLQSLLGSIGSSPSDVDIILHTHLHYDHVGNDRLFSNATIYAHQQELSYYRDPTAPLMRQEYFAPKYHYPPQFDAERIESISADTTIAPGLDFIHLPGHTPGSSGVLIETADGLTCFAGDLVMVRENLDPKQPVGLHVDVDMCERSRRKLNSYGAQIIPSHDMRIFDVADVRKLA